MNPRSRALALAAVVVALVSIDGGALAKPPERSSLLIVRVKKGSGNSVAAKNKWTIVERLVGNPENDDVMLVRVDGPDKPDHAAAKAAKAPSVKKAEAVALARLPESRPAAVLVQSTMAVLDGLDGDGVVPFGPAVDGARAPMWSGYVDQPGAKLVRISPTPRYAIGIGAGTVIAVIDTGIDPEHPVLQSRVLGGWDFIQERPDTASVRATTSQATMAILDQSTMAILDQRTRAFLRGFGEVEELSLDDSTTALVATGVSDALAGSLGPAVGHGTMVAGLAHLVAPGAAILPLRAFDDYGVGNTFDLIQAIHYAVREGATVINMSFSLDRNSSELEAAIEFAARQGVICVAAAGNDGASVLVYPAALETTIGVAATDLEDFVAPFSNFGSDLVALAAPGVSVITTYPGGGWAIGSGTSFAAPWIAGTVALLAERAAQNGVTLDLERALDALSDSADVRGPLALQVGFGRLDVERAKHRLSTDPSGP